MLKLHNFSDRVDSFLPKGLSGFQQGKIIEQYLGSSTGVAHETRGIVGDYFKIIFIPAGGVDVTFRWHFLHGDSVLRSVNDCEKSFRIFSHNINIKQRTSLQMGLSQKKKTPSLHF